jgi:hypothetical protein
MLAEMSVAPYHHDALSCSSSANTSASIKNDLFSEHIPAQKSRSLTDTANVKVGESVTLGKTQMALLAARDIYRPGEVIYLEFIPIQRVYSKPTKYTFRKVNHIHLDSVGGVRYVNHRYVRKKQQASRIFLPLEPSNFAVRLLTP